MIFDASCSAAQKPRYHEVASAQDDALMTISVADRPMPWRFDAASVGGKVRRVVRRVWHISTAVAAMAVAGLAHAAPGADPTPFVFVTNWYAQAEQGGYYQAQAYGLYRQAGLDVTIKMGGPQINLPQLLAAGQADCVMGSSDAEVLFARERGIPMTTVAAFFQKDPQGIVARPEVKDLADLKDATFLIPPSAHLTYWPWLKARFGFDDSKTRPYAFGYQMFLSRKDVAQQGYATYDPFALKKRANMTPKYFLLADYGWPPYSNLLVCSDKAIHDHPDAIRAFVHASQQGWHDYLNGDNAKANLLIKQADPSMTDDQIAYSTQTMKRLGLVEGGDASKYGDGTITDAREKATYDFFVRNKLIDPTKVDLKSTYTTVFLKH